jgi:DNA-binding GntR family transcriptional regulator
MRNPREHFMRQFAGKVEPRHQKEMRRRLAAKSLADSVRAEMEQGLLAGTFAPGQIVDERSLAQKFGVSRSPVRQAIQSLASLGMLKVVPRFGVVVPKLREPQLHSLFEMLAYLEGLCAMLSASRMNAAERQTLCQAQLACEAAARRRSSSDVISANRRFHETICSGARNEWASMLIHGLRVRATHYQRSSSKRPRRLQDTIHGHRAIVVSIVGENAEAARDAMIAHILACARNPAECFTYGGQVDAKTVGSAEEWVGSW